MQADDALIALRAGRECRGCHVRRGIAGRGRVTPAASSVRSRSQSVAYTAQYPNLCFRMTRKGQDASSRATALVPCGRGLHAG